MTFSDLAGISARVTFRIASPNPPDNLAQMKRQFVAEGADPDGLGLELAAFNSFCFWAASARAMQKRKFTAANFEFLITEHIANLRTLARDSAADMECFDRFGVPLAEFVNKRLDRLCLITVEVAPQDVLRNLVETFCGFMSAAPSIGLKLCVQTAYLQTEGSTYDRIAGHKLI